MNASKDDIQRAKTMMDDLEIRRKNLIKDERLFRQRQGYPIKKYIQTTPIKNDKEILPKIKTEKIDGSQPNMLDYFLGSAAVLRHGILKQVNQPFIDLLGYDSNILLEKNLIDFIAPEGISVIEKYFSDKRIDKKTFNL